jgi:hypothetical protein
VAETSPKTGQELFYHLIGKIFDEQINSFSELKEYLAKIAPATLTDVRYYAMINKVFSMIRRLSWGFFTNLNKQNFERLWNELVVEDKRWTQAGDLKKTITLSNLFI